MVTASEIDIKDETFVKKFIKSVSNTFDILFIQKFQKAC